MKPIQLTDIQERLWKLMNNQIDLSNQKIIGGYHSHGKTQMMSTRWQRILQSKNNNNDKENTVTVKLNSKLASEWSECRSRDADGYNVLSEYANDYGTGPYLNSNGSGNVPPIAPDELATFISERTNKVPSWMGDVEKITITPMKRIVDSKKAQLEARAQAMRVELNKLDDEIAGVS